jgi:hypothetical protein
MLDTNCSTSCVRFLDPIRLLNTLTTPIVEKMYELCVHPESDSETNGGGVHLPLNTRCVSLKFGSVVLERNIDAN